MILIFLVPTLQQPPIAQLDTLAQNRDVAGLQQFLADPKGKNPFSILKTGGGYVAGTMGWRAKLLMPKSGREKFVVFSTPIIEEDEGELLFRMNPGNKLEYVPESNTLGVDLDRHSFDVSFDLPAHKTIITDRLQCHWTGEPRPYFLFRFSPTFQVSTVSDSKGVPVVFSQAGGVVAISPAGLAATKATLFHASGMPKGHLQLAQDTGREGTRQKTQDIPLTFTVHYSGTVEKPGFPKVIGPQEATLSGTVWYPMIGRHPAPYDIAIHAKKEWMALAQGEEVSDQVSGEERITKYRMDLPVVWFSASAGPYRSVTSEIGGRKYRTMSAAMSEDDMRVQNEYSAEVIDFYSQNFGPYPFTRWTTLDSTQFEGGVGALEAYSIATYPPFSAPGQDSHEPSHCWWGGMINNDYLVSLWNESFAVFCQGFFDRNRPVGDRTERQRAFVSPLFTAPEFDAAPLARAGQEIGPAATALGYGKGALVLQVLEDEIGTENMRNSMKEWVKTNPPRHIGRWEDFEACVDRVTGKIEKWFFDEWVRGTGLPSFTLTGVNWSNGRLGGTVTFKGKPYRMDCDLLSENPNGERQYKRVKIDAVQDSRFSIDCPQKPSVVALDPWQKIPRSNLTNDAMMSIATAVPNYKAFVDPTTPDFLKSMRTGNSPANLPSDLGGWFLIGSPESLKAMAPLCKQVGFSVSGSKLTFLGTTIDLKEGGAVALVDLPGGKHCAIGLGICASRPDSGRARVILFNRRGQVLRAVTDPLETGALSFRLSD